MKIITPKTLAITAVAVVVALGSVFFASIYSTNAHADGSVEALYQSSCATCHASGVLGAHKTGDVAAWKAATAGKTPAQLLASVKNGYKNMPARGLCNSCSDDDYQALTSYMMQR